MDHLVLKVIGYGSDLKRGTDHLSKCGLTSEMFTMRQIESTGEHICVEAEVYSMNL